MYYFWCVLVGIWFFKGFFLFEFLGGYVVMVLVVIVVLVVYILFELEFCEDFFI